MNPRVKNVVPSENYTLHIEFTNGEKGVFDVKPLFKLPIFEHLKDIAQFNKVSVGNGKTVCWGDDIDICPDTVYCDSQKR